MKNHKYLPTLIVVLIIYLILSLHHKFASDLEGDAMPSEEHSVQTTDEVEEQSDEEISPSLREAL